MHDALLRAVLDAPDDDAPRLILADWLEEHGGEADRLRADFIRTQVAYAAIYPHLQAHRQDDCSICGRGMVLSDLLLTRFRVTRNRPHHFLPGDPFVLLGLGGRSVPSIEWDYHRGFVREVRLDQAAFLTHAAALFAAHPIRRVTLTDREPLRDSGGWWWSNVGGLQGAMPHYLSSDLLRLIPPTGGAAGGYRRFVSRDDALADLSSACVLYGRQAAALRA